MSKIHDICLLAFGAKSDAIALTSQTKNKILGNFAETLWNRKSELIAANEEDLKIVRNNNLEKSKIDRLLLDENRIRSICNTINSVIELDDPIGKLLYHKKMPSGIDVKRISCSIGVIAAIYESRPNVTADIATLCIKSSNVAILRSGSDCFNSSHYIYKILTDILVANGVNRHIVNFIDDNSRELVKELLKMDGYIDLLIPRGGVGLVSSIIENTKIPVMKHLDGNCHIYIESEAELEKARKVVLNGKMRRVSICSATESLLIDRAVYKEFLPKIIEDLVFANCEIRGDEEVCDLDSRIIPAKEEDYYKEYLDSIISVKIVNGLGDAIEHINKYGSHHTDSIITENQAKAKAFFQQIDSAVVMINSSTQFSDGGEFGLGSEIGISTGKLHARGPVGLEQLTIYKYLVESNGALRK